MDPLNLDTTSFDSGGQVIGTDGSPSTGLDVNGLLSQLLGNATTAYVASQAQPNVIVPASAPAGYVNIGGTNYSTKTLLIVGGGLIMFALVLRR